ncbi:YesL family protein [Radiobacillus sp. PE A8.2]|uniref:YesL family protein n=1 Tax=Radiobacillus sp. PE A8.2 TaxID=3380349 RepID=UPI00388DD636
MTSLIEKLYRLSEWIMKLAYVNFLWIFFTIVGLGVFGFFPGTVAMFTIIRKWLMKDVDAPIFKTFWHAYRKDFLRANILGFSMIVIGYLLYVDYRFFQSTGSLLQPISFIFIILLFLYFVVFLYIFPVFVHYEYKLFEYIKYSLVIALGKPFQTFVMVMSSFILLFVFQFLPGLIPFFAGSLMSIVLMWIAANAFPKEE